LNIDEWLRATGKGQKRELPVLPVRWNPASPAVGSLEADRDAATSTVRLWMVMHRFFPLIAKAIEAEHAPLAEKLRRANPHWMRHTHATHVLSFGGEAHHGPRLPARLRLNDVDLSAQRRGQAGTPDCGDFRESPMRPRNSASQLGTGDAYRARYRLV
jgi:hypothetical protein